MNYELAQKLMDSGYPQNFGDGEFLEGPMEIDAGGPVTNNSAYAPTLSELIVACGADKENFTLISLPSLGKWGRPLILFLFGLLRKEEQPQRKQ